MPKAPKGELRWTEDGPVARITMQGRRRKSFPLSSCRTPAEAEARCELVSTWAQRFRKAGVLHTPDALQLLQLAASSAPALLTGVVQVASELVGGEMPGAKRTPTFRELAKEWTSGALHTRHPDHVKSKDSDLDATRLGKLFEIDIGGMALGDVPLDRFALDHAETAMRHLPEEARRPATRRQYAQLINRVLALAVYPCRLIPANPLPRGFLPKVGKPPAFPYLYPSEDAALLAKVEVAIGERVLFGFMAREGMRAGEATRLQWKDVDLERGAVTLDENKTDDARTWALDPGVTRALRLWKERVGGKPGELVFVDAAGGAFAVDKLAERLRRDLLAADVARSELHDAGVNRGRLRAHDLRGTFVTLALAAGRSEAWVADRTGHTSSQMINRYRRSARSAMELGLGPLAPLDQAIPELRLPRDCPSEGSAPVVATNEPARNKLKAEVAEPADAADSKGVAIPPRSRNTRRGVVARSDDQVRVAPTSGQSGGNPTDQRTPRERMIATLNAELGLALAAGDLEAARVAHEALGRLLGASGSAPPAVLDLASERARRDGKR